MADPTLMDAKLCQVCPANHKAVQNGKSGSLNALAFETYDQCIECAGDEKSSSGSAQCTKLNCPLVRWRRTINASNAPAASARS